MALGPGLSKSVLDRKLYLNLSNVVKVVPETNGHNGDDEGKLTVASYGGVETTQSTGLHIKLADKSGLIENTTGNDIGLKINLGTDPGLDTSAGLGIKLKKTPGNAEDSGLSTADGLHLVLNEN